MDRIEVGGHLGLLSFVGTRSLVGGGFDLVVEVQVRGLVGLLWEMVARPDRDSAAINEVEGSGGRAG